MIAQGGSWVNTPQVLGLSTCYEGLPSRGYSDMGFRVASVAAVPTRRSVYGDTWQAIQGGSWCDESQRLRFAHCPQNPADDGGFDLGFRVASVPAKRRRGVVRGGGYFAISEFLWSALRIWKPSDDEDDDLGFRVVSGPTAITVRGGSGCSPLQEWLRSSHRNWQYTDVGYNNIGFRVASVPAVQKRKIRGSSWLYGSWSLRSANHSWSYTGVRSDSIGFRVASKQVVRKPARCMVRGGSWYNTSQSLCSAYLFRYSLDGQGDYIGFRVASKKYAVQKRVVRGGSSGDFPQSHHFACRDWGLVYGQSGGVGFRVASKQVVQMPAVRGGSWNFTPRYLRSALRYRSLALYRYDSIGFRVVSVPAVRKPVLRGGSWGNIPLYLRSAYRFRSYTDSRDYDIGFRVASVPAKPTKCVLRGGGWYNRSQLLRSAYHLGYNPDGQFDFVGFRPVSTNQENDMTPEGRVKAQVKTILKGAGEEPGKLYYFMPVQTGMGKRGLDFHCVYRGMAFFIETKAPGGKLTPLQENTKEEMEASGSPVFVVRTGADMGPVLKWISQIDLTFKLMKPQAE